MSSKYVIETSIAMRAGYRNLLQQQDFSDSDIKRQLKKNRTHIYMICTRPRITIKRDSIVVKKDTVELIFQKNIDGYVTDINCICENKFNYNSYALNPACNLISFLKDGKEITFGKTSLLYPLLIPTYDSCLDMHVLYVGQAFGKNGERLASDRLISHSTLQEIYSDANVNYPYNEIWLILWQFEPYYISMMGSMLGKASESFNKSLDNFNSIMNSNIPLDQQVTVTEAALINYFKPKYNEKYKTNFPDNSHLTYEDCYSLDFNSVCFELDTVSLKSRLYSENVEPNIIHAKTFPLWEEVDRKCMFNIF